MDAVEPSPSVILLVMEYRSRANAWLSEKVHRSFTGQQHVVAEFIRHLRGRHARSDELDLYFELWLHALDVDQEEYDGLCASIDMAAHRAPHKITLDPI
jgi:hypothetical protein